MDRHITLKDLEICIINDNIGEFDTVGSFSELMEKLEDADGIKMWCDYPLVELLHRKISSGLQVVLEQVPGQDNVLLLRKL